MNITQHSVSSVEAMRKAYARHSSHSMNYCPDEQTLLAMLIAGTGVMRDAEQERAKR